METKTYFIAEALIFWKDVRTSFLDLPMSGNGSVAYMEVFEDKEALKKKYPKAGVIQISVHPRTEKGE